MKKYKNPLKPGDVIRTHPARGYWGCAVVLSAKDGDGRFYPMSHIGITTFISKTRYEFLQLARIKLKLVKFKSVIRVAPNEYYKSRETRTSIYIHTILPKPVVDVIGTTNPKKLYGKRLTFEPGDGTGNTFPWSGPLTAEAGDDAVNAWREKYDAAALRNESAKHMAWFEKFEADRLAAARKARRRRARLKVRVAGRRGRA